MDELVSNYQVGSVSTTVRVSHYSTISTNRVSGLLRVFIDYERSCVGIFVGDVNPSSIFIYIWAIDLELIICMGLQVCDSYIRHAIRSPFSSRNFSRSDGVLKMIIL